MNYDFVHYLEAKQSVDDRALHRGVADGMERFVRALGTQPRVLEIGAGHGAMVERLAARGLLETARYTAVDPDVVSIEAAKERFQSDDRIGTLELRASDLYTFAEATSEKWDLVVAHAVLDLLDLELALPALQSLSVSGGGFYFTINFDGGTVFEPIIDPVLDAEIVARYHETMDERVVGGRRSGHSQTGRRLFGALAARGATIECAGSSDWVVWPTNGEYDKDEAYFLHFIVATVEEALVDSPGLEAKRLHQWARERHEQIDRGVLVYVAHQLDFFGRWPKVPNRRR